MSSEEQQIKTLKRKRANIKGQLTRFESFLTRFNNEFSQLKSRIEQTKKLWNEFDEVQVQIEVLEGDDEDERNLTERTTFEECYFTVIANANDILETNQTNQHIVLPAQNVAQSSNLPSVKFPRIDLPKFSGQYDEFMTFHDSFKTLVHDNPSLNDVERFHYLRSSLKGEAAHVISCLETTAVNYQVAWKLIQDRYDNKRLIVHNHIRALFELNTISKESHVSLRLLLDNMNKHIRALETLKEPVDTWDTILIYLLSSKLDSSTRREWELFADSLSTPKISDFATFLNKRCSLLETISHKKPDVKPSPSPSPSPFNNKSSRGEKFNSQSYVVVNTCWMCKKGHKVTTCDTFLQLTPKSRYFEVKKHKLCTNCLEANHSNQTCTNETKCSLCNKKHHLLLHFDNNVSDNGVSEEQAIQTVTFNSSMTVHTSCTDNQVLLSTAVVFISDASGKQHKCRVLLDSGSQSNFITEELCNILKLNKQNINSPVTGLGQSCTSISHMVQTKIKSIHNNFNSELCFLVINCITDNLPLNYINSSHIQIPSNIKLADPSYNVPVKIDALIGASLFWDLLCIGQFKLPNSQIIAQKTKLGWVLSGQVMYSSTNQNSNRTLCHFSSTMDIQRQLESFWQIEQYENRPMWSWEQKACEENFTSTHTRETDGRFSVQLPLRNDEAKLGDSKQMALKRFYSMEKKLQRNPELKVEYVNFMEEYESLSHMTEVSHDVSLNFLPHHSVIKDSSTTTKVRVVFDASAKTESGVSLNDILMTGPTIQQELFSIILRFRKHQFVLTADCVKMYRQVMVQENQRCLQAIVWRSDPEKPIKMFTLDTVTYGTSSASFLAVRCLHQLADENCSKHPHISKIIKSDFYVDDLITGHDTVEGIRQIKVDLIEVLSQGKFELRKWRSNDSSVVGNDLYNKSFEFSENKESKTLGLVWNSQLDVFQYNLQDIPLGNNYVTKRAILSYISKIFDPLGLIGPIIIKAKIILQQLWLLSLDWDESVPSEIYSSWKSYQGQIQSLKNISVPRHVICKSPIRVEVHSFCDASETAYGACIYVRSLNCDGAFSTKLLCGKSRVAPLKKLSLPRLELCGALLAAKLCHVAVRSLDMPINQYFYWCDSSIALTWILDEPYKWKTFVGNRVAEIQEVTDKNDWRHIKSEDNPADIISRGINPIELVNSDLWWYGPKWLEYNSSEWPSSIHIKTSDIPEKKNNLNSLIVIEADLYLFTKYSSFLKLQRVVAFILRFKNNTLKRMKGLIEHGPLKPQELELSLKHLVRLAQTQTFYDEIKLLKAKKSISNKSVLKNLNPFLDEDQILRVGGRLKHSNFDYDHKHPMILPKGHPLTKLIIIYEHRKLLHAGPQALLANIRTRFWPIAGRNEVRKILKNCIVCFKVKPVTVNTLLGQLPRHRVTPSRPFVNCAVDYAGPFYIKVGLPRSKQLVKAYLCVFICLATKALHLELAIDLSSNSFLNAFKRFISRRGKCLNIYSDNGTNFVGANHELNNFLNEVRNQNTFADFFASQNTTWHFIPPRSPHFGGIWESAVKSVKFHLRRVVGNASLTYEEFNTIIVQVEACLNSRPLSPLSTNPDDLNPLTPGHFLIGCPLVAVPEPDLTDVKTGRLTRYQHLTQIMQHFWKRWSKDYITELQARSSKGVSNHINIIPGTMVMLVDDNLPPLLWSMGRVQQVHPGDDGIVRVVTVKTASGVFKRAVRKLCVLPTE